MSSGLNFTPRTISLPKFWRLLVSHRLWYWLVAPNSSNGIIAFVLGVLLRLIAFLLLIGVTLLGCLIWGIGAGLSVGIHYAKSRTVRTN